MTPGADTDVTVLSPAQGHFERGQTLALLDRWPEALDAYESAVAAWPQYPEAWHRHAVALHEMGEHEEALASVDTALRWRPRFPDAFTTRSIVLRLLNRVDEAIDAAGQALACDPDDWAAYTARGNALRAAGRNQAALESYDQALLRSPANASARMNRALCLLITGDMAGGWPEYEWRWRTAQHQKRARVFEQPLWLGHEPLAGRTILLHAEQGLGDTLHFCRYAPMVAASGARVLIGAGRALQGLLTTLDGVSLIVSQADPIPRFDLQCPLLSLPLAFGTRLDTIPANTPYLAVPAVHRRKWQARLGPRRGTRIGIAWSGNPEHRNDVNRSIPLDLAAGLFVDGIEVHCLQQDVRPRDVPAMAMMPQVVFHGPELIDFSDTAALAAEMDLVISVDTAVLHLAGALGLETWAMLPFASDWRWLLDRADSPWYPTMRLFRQAAPGDWGPVIAAVRAGVQRRAASPVTPR